MVTRYSDVLAGLLGYGYTLTHMTGYRRDAAEWLAQVVNGEMRYHSTQGRSAEIEIHGLSPFSSDGTW